MERLLAFLPSVLILATIAGASFLYIKLIIKHYGDNYKSVEWQEKNQWKIALTVGIPQIIIFHPALEELIFRVPIVLAFSKMSSVAWYGVLVSSCLFALVHWLGGTIFMSDILSAAKDQGHKSDDVEVVMKRLRTEKGNTIMMGRIIQVVSTLILGSLAGFYSIKYQSIWVAFGIHLVWNLVVPFTTLTVIILGTITVFCISSLWNKMKLRRKLKRIRSL